MPTLKESIAIAVLMVALIAGAYFVTEVADAGSWLNWLEQL